MSNDQQVSKKRRYASAIITVVAGRGGKSVEFYVHEDLLREHSDFFKVALNGQWKEAKKRRITLPEDHPDVVDMYIQWLYGGAIAAAVPQAWRQEGRVSSVFWARGYNFSEKIRDHAFANAIMDAWTSSIDQPLANGTRRFVCEHTVSEIYQHTSPGSLVRKFLVYLYTTYRLVGWLTNDSAAEVLLGCPEFLLDLARATAPKRSKPHQSLNEMREKWLYEV